jgi:competence protein ComEA
MRSRRPAHEDVAEVARRRLELLSAELAGVRRDVPESGSPVASDGPGEPPSGEAVPGEREPSPVLPLPDAAPSVAPRPGRHARRPVGGGALLGGWLHDRMPPTLQGRVQLGSSHLTVVAVAVAAALAVTAWLVLRADAAGTVVSAAPPHTAGSPSALVSLGGAESGAPVAPAPSAASPGSSPGSTAAPVLVVDVAGKVRRPGIVTLPVGSRVVDALEAAGGARPGVDLRVLNLARPLVDGEQILVGIAPAPGVAASAAAAPTAAPSATMVHLNSAGQAELETLPGVGPVTAAAILQWRTENGAFTSVDELLEVSGIGEATLAEIAPFVTL